MHKLTMAEIAKFQKDYHEKAQNNVAKLAVVNNGLLNASYNHEGANKLNRTFSIEVPTDNVTNQKQSGRCWLFAALNTLRHKFAQTNKAKNFTLSQSYLFFWDRIERANIFFENIIEIILVIIGLIIAINGFEFMFLHVGTTEATGNAFMVILSLLLWIVVQPLFNLIGESKTE